MSVKTALRAILLADSDVTALVGTRIWAHGSGPQQPSLPYIMFSRVSTPRGHTHDGPDGWAKPRFQFDYVAGADDDAETGALAILGALDGYSGTIAGADIGSIVSAGQLDNNNRELGYFMQSVDFMVQHSETFDLSE